MTRPTDASFPLYKTYDLEQVSEYYAYIVVVTIFWDTTESQRHMLTLHLIWFTTSLQNKSKVRIVTWKPRLVIRNM